jgi:hypothetical protein
MFKKTTWFLLLLIPLLAVACGSGPETAVAPPAEQSDVVSAEGKPQLIEFYADW